MYARNAQPPHPRIATMSETTRAVVMGYSSQFMLARNTHAMITTAATAPSVSRTMPTVSQALMT